MNNIVEFIKSDCKVSAANLFNDSSAPLLIVMFTDNRDRVDSVTIFRNTTGKWFHSDDFFRIIICNEPEAKGKVHYSKWIAMFEDAIENRQLSHTVEQQLEVFKMIGEQVDTYVLTLDNRHGIYA